MIIAPADMTDCYYTAAEARNLAEKYQLQASIISERCLTNRWTNLCKPIYMIRTFRGIILCDAKPGAALNRATSKTKNPSCNDEAGTAVNLKTGDFA